MPPALILLLFIVELLIPPLAVIALVSWAWRLRGRGDRRWWLPLLPLTIPAVLLAWLFLCFTPQVNASMTAQRASREIAMWRGEQQGVPPIPAVASRLERGGGALPPTIRTLDYWGHPFLYIHDADCFVLVSYGSDGKPDSGEAYDLSLCAQTTKRSTCTWPTMDTVFVNGDPLRYCLK